jgi:outer membrane protein OmpA-like peptidoglycan-associated protein
MRKIISSFILTSFLFAGTIYAQTAPENPKSKKKDSQNQTQYFKEDMEAKDFNFYDRKKISTPLQPRYDLDSAVYQSNTKKKHDQQKAYLANKYNYPAKPKNQWELGINGGSFMISGDIASNPLKSWGVGFSVRKALGYSFSIRGGYTFGYSQGQDFQPRSNAQFDQALNGSNDNKVNYFQGKDVTDPTAQQLPKDLLFHNYRTLTHNIDLDLIYNIGNLLFHKERNKVNLNVFIGIGGHISRVQMDMLDGNGKMYNYAAVNTKYNILKASGVSKGEVKKQVTNDLKALQDGKFETDAESPRSGWQAKIGKYNLEPSVSMGFGLDFHATKWMTVGLQERFIINHNDLLDGTQWQEDAHAGFTPNYDNIFYTSVQLLFHLGKKAVEPLYWLNPMDYTYKKLGDVTPDKLANEILKDDDEDGVPNKLDKEPNTKKGAPVDVKGVALDNDKDGVIDLDDKEPFSPPGYPIDQFGVAQVPPPACCTELAAGGNKAGKGAYDCSRIELPGVYFDDDKYYVSPEYYGGLHSVAERLQMCPDVKMIITGFDESKNDQKYNEQLAYNRVNSVVDYLVEKYGISRDRFVVKYQGSKKATSAKTEQERKKARKVAFQYAADGEKGDGNPPAPHPGLKAGSNK